jgi:hypothetical protein
MQLRARQDKLLVRDVQGEVLIYDEEHHRAHHLNRTASLVWRHCDGQKTASEIAVLLQAEMGSTADEDLVRVALEDLRTAHLLVGSIQWTAEQASISRREVIRRAGLAGALAVLIPVVTSMPAPAAANHSSGDPRGDGEDDDDE